MPQGQLDSFINFIIPVILLIVAIGWVWLKFGESLKKLGGAIKGLFASTKEKTFNTVIASREIVYDI